MTRANRTALLALTLPVWGPGYLALCALRRALP